MSSEQHIKLLIVDDHQIVRDGVKALLKSSKDIDVIGEASHGLEALEFLKKSKGEVDVIIMDITMPVMDGVTATKQILKEFPLIKILALSMHDDESHIITMLKQGALGYVLKTTGKSELEHAIARVSEGQSYFSKQTSSKILDYISSGGKRNQKSVTKLTEREKEVLLLIADELTNAEIAEKLFVSHRTVDTHRRNLLQKLNAKNTAGLVKYALQNELKPRF